MTDKYEKEDDEEYEDEEVSSESEDEYEDEAEDAEASDESGEDEDSVESWGYEEKKSRFSKEVIAGFAAVALLLTVFGVVVYKKRFPSADASGEVVTAGPEASLGSPQGTPPEVDPNDPFAEGAENNLGPQSEPGDGQQDDLLTAGTIGQPAGDGSGSGTSFVSTGTDVTGSGDLFASNSETTDLFASQTEPGTGSGNSPVTGGEFGSADSSLTSTATGQPEPFADDRRNVFGGPSSELADSGSSDPFPATSGVGGTTDPLGSYSTTDAGNSFDNPGLTDGSLSSSPGFDSTGTGSTPGLSSDNQFAQNDPSLGGNTGSTFPADSSSGFTSEPTGSTNDPLNNDPFGGPSTAMTSEPFGASSDNSAASDPFGEPSSSAASEPSGLFDRSPSGSLSDSGLNNPSGTGLSNGSGFDDPQPLNSNSEFGSSDSSLSSTDSTLDSSPLGTSSEPFGSNEPFGASDTGASDNGLSNPGLDASPVSNEPFGSSSDTAANDPFGNSSSDPKSGFDSGSSLSNSASEPANLFSGSDPASSSSGAATDPFQPPLTSTADGSGLPASTSASSTDSFGNESFSADSAGTTAAPTTFAGRPGNTGTYTVQAGDSYWNISKKVYGTAKYFQVLADYNSKTISDPQKMKTGAVIQTPDAAVLQSRLKTVRRPAPTGLTGRIESAGPANRSGITGLASSSGESVVVSRRPATQTEPSGILFNQQGYPMYRIGDTDTLTSIAAEHLGRASRWEQVYNMNRDQLQSPDKLQIGMVLKLPADASRVPLVDRTSSLR